jgi:hypothetical protein
MSLKASRFLAANILSPVVYGSVEEHLCTYRLKDGSVWAFSRREAASSVSRAGRTWWPHEAHYHPR